jgi:hypothetical protein
MFACSIDLSGEKDEQNRLDKKLQSHVFSPLEDNAEKGNECYRKAETYSIKKSGPVFSSHPK